MTDTTPAARAGDPTIRARAADGTRYLYVLKEELGGGAFATVWRAQRLPDDWNDANRDDTRPTPQVAVKVAHSNMKAQGSLAREAAVLAELHRRPRRATTRIVGVGLGGQLLKEELVGDEGSPVTRSSWSQRMFLELEYLQGPTLREWLDGRGQPQTCDSLVAIEQAVAFAVELADALDELSTCGAQGVMHRDVKPSNVIKTAGGLKLFDFNVARPGEADGAAMTQGVGTGSYRAPEVIQGRAYDESADLWSVGVIFWEVMHGARPADLWRPREDGTYVHWPSDLYDELAPQVADAVRQVITRLLCDAAQRIKDIGVLRGLLAEVTQAIHHERLAGEEAAWPAVLERFQLTDLIMELREGGLVSVVADADVDAPIQAWIRDRIRVDDPLEDFLVERISEVLAARDPRPALVVLSGNAGDGKSHLLKRLMDVRLGAELASPHVRCIADATHSLTPTETQRERLDRFFAPFANDATEGQAPAPVHLIAMNTGMVIRYFDEQNGTAPDDRFSQLYAELQRQLGLLGGPATQSDPLPWRVLVVNLDLRNLLHQKAGGSFIERMLDRLGPSDENGMVAPLWKACHGCSARSVCPVQFNLSALAAEVPRRALLEMLRLASLDPEVHISPRGAWSFLYRVITGGRERYDRQERGPGDGACDVIRERALAGDGPWLLAGQFTETLFAYKHAGVKWAALHELDPAYAPVPEIDRLATLLTVYPSRDVSPDQLDEELGATGACLHGLQFDTLLDRLCDDKLPSDARRNAAIRRHAFFHRPTLAAIERDASFEEFQRLLDAYGTYSSLADPSSGLTLDEQEALDELRQLITQVFVRARGQEIGGRCYLQVSQPNVFRSSSQLLVRAEEGKLKRQFLIRDLVRRDVHMVAHEGDRWPLLELLGNRPRTIDVRVSGRRLRVDRQMFEFLKQIRAGRQVSARDLGEFQALGQIGDRLGNDLARADDLDALYILDRESNRLHRLEQTQFGGFKIVQESGGAS